jgi:basic amino acid/polyamine antiporter, APA family
MAERRQELDVKPGSPDLPENTPGLHRTLGLGEVTAGGVGIIIGAGIYVLIGAATAHAGEMVWLAFFLAAVLSALTGLSYAELASMYPSAAAEYEYTRQALPEWIAFVVGWVMVAGLVVAAATVSLGFARYAGYFFDIGIRPAALALLAGLAVLATIGIKQSVRVTVVLSAVQVGGLVIVIVIGAPHVGDVRLLTGPGVGGVLSGAALVFFAFIGFDEVITLAEDGLGAGDAGPAGGAGGLDGPRGVCGRRDSGVPAAIRRPTSGRVRAPAASSSDRGVAVVTVAE